MPRKAKKKTVADLTDKQINIIADRLRGSKGNVYDEVKWEFGIEEAGDEIFDILEKDRSGKAGIFRCENCDYWQNVSQKDKDVHGLCVDCVEKMDRMD